MTQINIEPTWFKTLAYESKSKHGVCPYQSACHCRLVQP